MTAACERFCNGGDGDDDNVPPLDYVRLCAAFAQITNDAVDRALAKAIEKYHWTKGWRKDLQPRDCWYSDAQPPTSDELPKVDQDLAYKTLQLHGGFIDPELINALWLFVPEERSEEILRSIRDHGLHPDYTPPTAPARSTVLEDSENGQGGMSMAEGGQEVGDAGQEGPEGMNQDADGADAEVSEAGGGADINAMYAQAGDGRTTTRDVPECEAADKGTAGDAGDLAGGCVAQRMSAMAESYSNMGT